MAINNPYMPGDPYSYDLKWIVRKIKEHDAILEALDQKIVDLIIQLLDQHDPLYWESADDLIHSDMKTPGLAYIEGFYEPGDGGANLFYLTSDYNDVLAADFYLTLDGANRWAIPIILTPFVTPEMFGAKADGTTDDSAAIEKALSFGTVKLMPGKTYEADYTVTITPVKAFEIYGNGATIQGFTLSCDGLDGIVMENFRIVKANKSVNLDNCKNAVIKQVEFMGEPSFNSPRFVTLKNCEHVVIKDCYVKNTQYGVFMQIYQMGRSKDVSVVGCRFENTRQYSYPAGIAVYEADQVRVSDCFFSNIQHDTAPYSNGYAVYSGDYVYNDIGSITVENCQMEDCGRGIRIHHASDLIVSSCFIRGTIEHSILVDGDPSLGGDPMNSTVISGNITTKDVSVQGYADNAVIKGNDITGTYGVFVYNASDLRKPKNMLISGNNIHDTSRGGIVIQHAEAPVVQGNTITNFNTSAYSSSDYRSAAIGFDAVSDPTALCNAITKPAAAAFGINFGNVTGRKIYLENTFNMDTNAILGGYNGAPTAGKWARGEHVYYVNPSSPNYVGAVCTASGDFDGTPPTFKQFGALV